ncbi:unnamed protein product, partial [marine sediment metagenome]
MNLLEAIFAALALFIVVFYINKLLPERNQIPAKEYIRSSAIGSLIIFGIILGIRYIFALLGYWVVIFRDLQNGHLFFAIMMTLFYPFLKIFLKKFGKSAKLNIKDILELQFKKVFRLFILSLWIIAGLFLSINLLHIPMVYDPFLEI